MVKRKHEADTRSMKKSKPDDEEAEFKRYLDELLLMEKENLILLDSDIPEVSDPSGTDSSEGESNDEDNDEEEDDDEVEDDDEEEDNDDEEEEEVEQEETEGGEESTDEESIVLAMISEDKFPVYEEIPEKFRNNEKIIDEYIKYHPSESHKILEELLIQIVKDKPSYYKRLTEEKKQNFELNLKLIDACGSIYKYLPKKYQENKWVMLKCAPFYKGEFSKNHLKPFMNDEDYVFRMLKWKPNIIKYSDDLKNKRIALESLKRDGKLMEYFDKFQNDKEMATIALNSNILSFEYLSEELKSDKEILLHVAKCSRFFSWEYNDYDSELEDFLEMIVPQLKKNGNDFMIEIFSMNNEFLSHIDSDMHFKMLSIFAERLPSASYFIAQFPNSIDKFEMLCRWIPELKQHENIKTKNGIDLAKIKDESILFKLLKLNGSFITMFDQSVITDEMYRFAYQNGYSSNEGQAVSEESILDCVKFLPSNAIYFLDNLNESEDLTVECLKIHPKLMTKLNKEFEDKENDSFTNNYSTNIRCIVACFHSINFAENRFDDCTTLDDYLCIAMNWMAPYEIRNNETIFRIVSSRRNFHFLLLNNKKCQDVCFKFQ